MSQIRYAYSMLLYLTGSEYLFHQVVIQTKIVIAWIIMVPRQLDMVMTNWSKTSLLVHLGSQRVTSTSGAGDIISRAKPAGDGVPRAIGGGCCSRPCQGCDIRLGAKNRCNLHVQHSCACCLQATYTPVDPKNLTAGLNVINFGNTGMLETVVDAVAMVSAY
jgi:hypothetical protein